MGRRFLRFPELKAELGIPWSRMHLDRLERQGKFPQRVRLSEATVGWWEDEVEAWLDARSAERASLAA